MTPALISVLLLLLGLLWFLSSRMHSWWKKQHSYVLSAQDIKASDLISVTSLALTIVSIVIGWYSISHQIQKGNLDIQIKDLSDNNTALRVQLSQRASQSYEAAVNDTDIHLESPLGDVRVLSQHLPELRWKYAKHGPGLDYLIEIAKVDVPDSIDRASFKLLDEPDCSYGAVTCRIRASSPSGQSTAIPITHADANHQGRYLWRVSPISVGFKGKNYPDPRWSEYGAFCFYLSAPVPRECLGVPPDVADSSDNDVRNRILVGTNYSANVDFSAVTNGSRHGYDIDLIRLIVEGCIRVNGTRFYFDPNSCEHSVADYSSGAIDGSRTETSADTNGTPLRVVFKSFDSIDEGLHALSQRQTDLFIGALTKARDRDHLPVRLSRGYFPFRSALFWKSPPTGEVNLKRWEESKPALGVIDGTTNQWLAQELIRSERLEHQVTLEAFSSFSGMKEALEQDRISSVIVDDTLRGQLLDVLGVDIPKAVRKRYLTRLGEDDEAFTIAVASGPQARQDSPLLVSLHLLSPSPNPEDSLYEAVDKALNSKIVIGAQKIIACRNNLDATCVHK